MHPQDWFMVFVAFFLPPVPVFIKKGFFSADFWINILLCLLGFLPGLFHALYIISQNPVPENGYQAVTSGGNYGSI